MTRRAQPDAAGRDAPAVCLHARDAAGLDVDAGYLAPLDEVDAQRVGGAGVGPCDPVVLSDPGARLEGPAEHGVARLGGDIDDRADVDDLVGPQPVRVDAIQTIGLDTADAVA